MKIKTSEWASFWTKVRLLDQCAHRGKIITCPGRGPVHCLSGIVRSSLPQNRSKWGKFLGLVSHFTTSNMATRTTTYFQDGFTYLQKKIYGTLLPSTKIKNNPKKKSKNTNFEKTPLHLAVAGYIGYYFLFIIGTVFENYWKKSHFLIIPTKSIYI